MHYAVLRSDSCLVALRKAARSCRRARYPRTRRSLGSTSRSAAASQRRFWSLLIQRDTRRTRRSTWDRMDSRQLVVPRLPPKASATPAGEGSTSPPVVCDVAVPSAAAAVQAPVALSDRRGQPKKTAAILPHTGQKPFRTRARPPFKKSPTTFRRALALRPHRFVIESERTSARRSNS